MINAYSVVLEITRKCNMKCAHCLRGPAQRKSMPRHVMYHTLRKFDYIASLCISGGETTLAIPELWMLRSEIINSQCDIGNMYIVTNAKNITTVRKKWKERDYHQHLQQLWIIVVANHSAKTYKKLNAESPDNVLVIDYRNLVSFLNRLNSKDVDFDIPPKKVRKLEALAKCTFYNRDEILKEFKSKVQQKKLEKFG